MSHSSDISQLLARLDYLETEIAQLRSERQPAHMQSDQLRWAVTCDPNAPEPTEEEEEPEAPPYPTGESNTFPIRFLDIAVDGEEGQQEADYDERSTKAQSFAHSPRGTWIPKGATILVMEHDGRGMDDIPEEGEPDKTLWFVVDPPTFYFGKLNGTLERGAFADVQIHLPGEEADLYAPGEDWWETDCVLRGQDRYLLEGESLEAGTWVEITNHFGRLVIRQAGCGPDEETE